MVVFELMNSLAQRAGVKCRGAQAGQGGEAPSALAARQAAASLRHRVAAVFTKRGFQLFERLLAIRAKTLPCPATAGALRRKYEVDYRPDKLARPVSPGPADGAMPNSGRYRHIALSRAPPAVGPPGRQRQPIRVSVLPIRLRTRRGWRPNSSG